MKNLLVVVANASRAQLWAVRHGELVSLEALSHPESRAKGAALASDRPGRAFDDAGGGNRSGMESPTEPREVEQQSFAREIARRVSIQARRGRVPEILIMAPPRFLGRVKAALEPTIQRRVVASISHDYTSKDTSELSEILAGMGIQAAVPVPV